MERRIFGLENEYGVTCTLRGQRRLSPDEVARYLFRRVVSWGRSSNVFLENGARLYLDVGSHPEYATPECDSLLDLVTHDKAGERILESLLGSAEQRLREEGIKGDIYLFKNNTDSAGNSYGCHENYCTSRADELHHYADVLIPFLVSRSIYAGAGKVLQTARGAVYCITGSGLPNARIACSFIKQHADDFWNHVTCPPHHHGVAYSHILASGFVFVVQSSIGHCYPANKNRGQLRNRCQFAGAAHLHVNAQHRG